MSAGLTKSAPSAIIEFASVERCLHVISADVYMHCRSLDRHVKKSHADHPVISCNQCGKSFTRSGNLMMHKRTCVGAPAPAVKRHRIGDVAPEFKVRRTRKSLGSAVEQFVVDMKESKYLSAMKKSVAVFKPAMTKFHQDHQAYKFQIAVDVVFHKAVDPAVITQPPVTLTSEMVAVYSDDASPLEDVNRQLLNFHISHHPS